MRYLILMGVVAIAGPETTQAQEFVGEVGACVIEDASGAVVNWNGCKRMPAQCNPVDCDITFLWQDLQSTTVITMPGPDANVGDGFKMNGQEAYAPAALRDSDPRDCIYNTVSDAVFCWVPGIDALTVAAGQLGKPETLMEIAREAAAASSEGIDPLLVPLQGKYIPLPTWSCEVTGGEGGAMEIRGNVFYGVENACTMKNGRPVGQHGAAIFDVTCEGEGETWQDEYIFKLDRWGQLGFLSSERSSTFEACE
jgi:hypothetical protein